MKKRRCFYETRIDLKNKNWNIPSIIFPIKYLHQIINPVVLDTSYNPLRFRQSELHDAIINHHLLNPSAHKQLELYVHQVIKTCLRKPKKHQVKLIHIDQEHISTRPLAPLKEQKDNTKGTFPWPSCKDNIKLYRRINTANNYNI